MPSLRRVGRLTNSRNNGQRNSNAAPSNAYAVLDDEDQHKNGEAKDFTPEQDLTSETSIALEETPVNETVIPGEDEERSKGSAWQPYNQRSGPYNRPSSIFHTQTMLNGNWRDRTSNGVANNLQTTRTRNHRTASRRTGYTHIPGPRPRSGVPFIDQNPGTIVWHWDIRPCQNPNIQDDDPRIVIGSDGSGWLKKGRFWVITSCTRHRVSEIPICTYDNKGLEQRPQAVWWECLSLKPPRLPSETSCKIQSPENPVIEIGYTVRADEVMRLTMVANYTEVVTSDIDIDDLRLVDDLSSDSKNAILECVKKAIGNTPGGDQ